MLPSPHLIPRPCPAADDAAAATPSRYDAINLTVVGFSIDTSGVVKLLDAAFPTEFKQQGLHCVAAPLAPTLLLVPGETNFTYTKQGDVLLSTQTILQRCNNDAKAYMEGTIQPLMKTHGLQAVIQGIYNKVKVQPAALAAQLNADRTGGFVVSGDTAYVRFNDVFDFNQGTHACTHMLCTKLTFMVPLQWKWIDREKHWVLALDRINSACGYNRDKAAALKLLKDACAAHKDGAVSTTS